MTGALPIPTVQLATSPATSHPISASAEFNSVLAQLLAAIGSSSDDSQAKPATTSTACSGEAPKNKRTRPANSTDEDDNQSSPTSSSTESAPSVISAAALQVQTPLSAVHDTPTPEPGTSSNQARVASAFARTTGIGAPIQQAEGESAKHEQTAPDFTPSPKNAERTASDDAPLGTSVAAGTKAIAPKSPGATLAPAEDGATQKVATEDGTPNPSQQSDPVANKETAVIIAAHPAVMRASATEPSMRAEVQQPMPPRGAHRPGPRAQHTNGVGDSDEVATQSNGEALQHFSADVAPASKVREHTQPSAREGAIDSRSGGIPGHRQTPGKHGIQDTKPTGITHKSFPPAEGNTSAPPRTSDETRNDNGTKTAVVAGPVVNGSDPASLVQPQAKFGAVVEHATKFPESHDSSPRSAVPQPATSASHADTLAEGHTNSPIAQTSVVQSVRILDRIGRSEMHIGLNTELGHVDVRTVVRDTVIGATISVEHSDLGVALAAELPRLEQALQHKQLDARVTLHDASGGTSSGFQHHQQSSEQDQRPTPVYPSRPTHDVDAAERAHRQHEPVIVSRASALNVRA